MLVGTVAMGLLFGANSLLFILFSLVKYFQPIPKVDSDALVGETIQKKEKKELSKPFIGTFDCFTNLTTELVRTGLILGLTYICEFHPFFAHSGKEYRYFNPTVTMSLFSLNSLK